MIKFVADALCVIVEIYLARYLFQAFLGECKLNKRNETILYIIAACVDMAYSYAPITVTQRMCCSFLNFTIVAQFYKADFLLKMFFVALKHGINLGCEFFAGAVLATLYSDMTLHMNFPAINNYIQGIFISKSIVAGIIFFIVSFKKQSDYYGRPGILCMYIILPMVTAVCLCQLGYATELIQTETANYRYLFVSCAMIATNIVLFFLFHRQMRIEQIHWQLKMAELREQMQQEYYSALIERDTLVSGIKHDMQNHLQFLKYKAENEEWETVRSYIDSLVEIMPQNKLHYTNHKTINTILSLKAKAAAEKGIALDISVPKEISNLKISDMDLVVLLANCLDNAIEAVEQLTEEKTVRLVISDKEDGIAVFVENACLQTETGKTLITSKANKQEHGYGIPNIRRIVEKYSGMFRIESEQQKFKVKIFLPK